MDESERRTFEDLIASIESGYQAESYEKMVQDNRQWGPSAGYHGPNPEPQDPAELEDLHEPCPPEED